MQHRRHETRHRHRPVPQRHGSGSGFEQRMQLDGSAGGEASPDDGESTDVEQREGQEPAVHCVVLQAPLRGLDGRCDVAPGEQHAAGPPRAPRSRHDGIGLGTDRALALEPVRSVRGDHAAEPGRADHRDDRVERRRRSQRNEGFGTRAGREKTACMLARSTVQVVVGEHRIAGDHGGSLRARSCVNLDPLVRKDVGHTPHYSIGS